MTTSLAQQAREAAWSAGAMISTAFRAGFADADTVEEKKSFADVVTATDREAERFIAARLTGAVPDSVFLGEEYGSRGEGATTWIVDPIDGTSNFASGLPFYSVSIGVLSDGVPVGAAVFDPERDEMFSSDATGFTLNGRRLRLDGRDLRDATCELLTNAPYEEPDGADARQVEQFTQWLRSFRAVRRLGSCALHLAYVAAGRTAVCFESKFSAWDIAAGMQLVQGAGGLLVAWDAEGRLVTDPASHPGRVKAIIAFAPGFDLRGSALAGSLPPAVHSEL